MIQVSGGSNDIGGGHKRVITLPDTVDPAAVKDGKCLFEPVSISHCLGEDEPENAEFIYQVVDPKVEANRGRRVKITAKSDGTGLGVPWTQTITMICPGRRCSFYLLSPTRYCISRNLAFFSHQN